MFIDWTQPANVDHPLLDDCVSWWLAGDGAYFGGPLFRDLMPISSRGGGNHGTLTSGPEWRSAVGRSGGNGSILFDGATSGQAVTTGFVFGKISTLSIWIQFRTLPGASVYQCPAIADEGGAIFHGFLAENSTVQYWNNIDSSGLISTATLSTGIWYNIVVVREGDSIANGAKLYTDGSLTDQTASDVWTPAVNGLWIGNQETSPTRTIDAYMDSIQVWDRALSAREVHDLYQDGRRGFPNLLNIETRTSYFVEIAAAGRTTYNTRSHPLGIKAGVNFRVTGPWVCA